MAIGFVGFRPIRSKNQQLVDLVGASLLGAVGSLPLHLAPIVISALVASGAASVQTAAWIVTAAMIGQICAATALPSIGIGRVDRVAALAAGVVMVAGVYVSRQPLFLAILGGWFAIGLSCGVFRYLSALAAAAYPNRTFAFGLRLAIVLMVASAVIYGMVFLGPVHSYQSLALDLQLILFAMLALGLWLYRPNPSGESASDIVPTGGCKTITLPQLAGLMVVFVLFAGQVGFLSYVMEIGLKQDIAADKLVLAFTAMKFVAGIALFYVIALRREQPKGAPITLAGLALMASIVSISYGGGIAWFLGGLLVFELALNILSSRLQATVVSLDTEIGGRWVTLAILGGAAVGPPLNGLAISSGLTGVFVAFSVLTVALALVWKRVFAAAHEITSR